MGEVVDVVEDDAAILVLADGRAAQVLGLGPGRAGDVAALAEDAVLAVLADGVLLVAPGAGVRQPVGRLAGLLGAAGAGAARDAEGAAARVVPVPPVVLRHVPRVPRVRLVRDQPERDRVLLRPRRRVVGVGPRRDVRDRARAVEVHYVPVVRGPGAVLRQIDRVGLAVVKADLRRPQS